MKATSKVNPERVLTKNSMYMEADGDGGMLIHSEKGNKSEKVRSVLSDLGIDFGFENYWEEMVDVDDYINEDIEDDDLPSEMMEMTKFELKIEDLKNDCPSLYSNLTERNQFRQMFRQYATDNNLLDEYVLN